MKYVLWLIRIIVGVLFIFSGLVKANDPLGLSYKMNEFFEVWNMGFMISYSLAFSVMMIGFEIIAGIAVLTGYAFRIFSFLLLLLTTFFTFLTAYVYLTDKIKECGCFGDCIKITNQETFWKDVILLILVIILFLYRKRIQPVFHRYVGASVIILTAFIAFGIQWWVLEHLPFHDCLPYKVGSSIPEGMKPPVGSVADSFKTVLYYTKDGERKAFDVNNIPWQDSTWKFDTTVTELVRKGNADPAIKDFSITDFEKNDYTEQILTTPGYTFFLFVKDPAHARKDNMDNLRSLMKKANELNIPFYVLSSGSKEETDAFRENNKLVPAEYMVFDATASKTALRANPGLMLLDKGTIVNKWSFRDYPRDMALDNGKLKLMK